MFLLTRANREQGLVQYEFLSRRTLKVEGLADIRDGMVLDRQDLKPRLPAVGDAIRQKAAELTAGYRLHETSPHRIFLVAPVRLSDRYYYVSKAETALLAVGGWEQSFAPPTLIEFILTMAARSAGSGLCPSLRSSRHLATKGCLFDFASDVEDVRYKCLTDFICDGCSTRLQADSPRGTIEALRAINSREWFGSADEPTSPAAIASRLGHDLFYTSGLKPTRRERLRSAATDEVIHLVFSVLAALTIALLLVLLGLR